MLRNSFREFFSLSRRRKRKAYERAQEIPAIFPPIRPRKEPIRAAVHIQALSSVRSRKVAGESAGILDYVLGFLFIGFLVLGGTLWTSKHGELAGSAWQSFAAANWWRHDSNGGTISSRELERVRATPSAQEPDTGEKVPVLEAAPSPKLVIPATYTDEARNAGYHGRVFVTVFVDALGVPEKIEPTSPIPFGLERPIRQAILQWRFKPALTRGNVAVASKTVVEVPFR
jgi:hypothetical protein